MSDDLLCRCAGCGREYPFPVTPETCGTCRLESARRLGVNLEFTLEQLAAQAAIKNPREFPDAIADEPTGLAPGTEAKIARMRERYERRQPIVMREDLVCVPDHISREVKRLRNGADEAGSHTGNRGRVP